MGENKLGFRFIQAIPNYLKQPIYIFQKKKRQICLLCYSPPIVKMFGFQFETIMKLIELTTNRTTFQKEIVRKPS